MARITGLDAALVGEVWPRVLAKLAREPVEDLRLDLEDGYGLRPDDEEDRHATAAGELLASLRGDGAPFVSGVRVKSLEAPTRRRGVRSLDLVLGAFGGALPAGFVVTLPKVTSVDQVEAMVLLCERLESAHGFPAGSLRFEVQVETPQAVLGADGTATVARIVHAAGGRCTGLHYGTYDYSASLGVAAAYQAMEHPVADHAKAVMQVAAAQTGVRVSDGSTNVLPVGDPAPVEAAWALHARLVRRSLERGIYQGWDLHPAQLPTRYLATYAFYRQRARPRRRRGCATTSTAGPAGARRAGHGVRAGRLPAARPRLRRAGRRRGGRGAGWPGRRRAARAGAARGRAAVARRAAAAELRPTLLAVCASPRWADRGRRRPRPYGRGRAARRRRPGAGRADRGRRRRRAGRPPADRRARRRSAASRREQAGVADDGPRRARRGQPRVRAAVRPRLPGLRQRPRRRGAARRCCGPAAATTRRTERAVVRDELGRINRLRLQRLLDEEARR